MKNDVFWEVAEIDRKDMQGEYLEQVNPRDLVMDLIYRNSEFADRANGYAQFVTTFRHAEMAAEPNRLWECVYDHFVHLEDFVLEVLENNIDEKDLEERAFCNPVVSETFT